MPWIILVINYALSVRLSVCSKINSKINSPKTDDNPNSMAHTEDHMGAMVTNLQGLLFYLPALKSRRINTFEKRFSFIASCKGVSPSSFFFEINLVKSSLDLEKNKLLSGIQ